MEIKYNEAGTVEELIIELERYKKIYEDAIAFPEFETEDSTEVS